MKKKICCIMALVLAIMMSINIVVFASEISLLNNNTASVYTNFIISDSGIATVYVEYEGYPNVATDAVISITIERKTWLLFWNDVVSETYYVTGDYYSNELYYQLEDTGTYRCTVEYVIVGTGGDDDTFIFEDTRTYG